MGMGPEWLLGGLLGMVLTLVIIGARAGARQARAPAPEAVTVATDFLAHRIADGSCEWVAGLLRKDAMVERVTANVLDRYLKGRS